MKRDELFSVARGLANMMHAAFVCPRVLLISVLVPIVQADPLFAERLRSFLVVCRKMHHATPEVRRKLDAAQLYLDERKE